MTAARIERRAYRRMLPAEFDRLSFREILLVIRATDDTERFEWRRTATVCTYVYNYGRPRVKGFRYKQPEQLFPKLYGRGAKDYDKRMQQAIDQEAEYLAQVAKKQERLKREAEQGE